MLRIQRGLVVLYLFLTAALIAESPVASTSSPTAPAPISPSPSPRLRTGVDSAADFYESQPGSLHRFYRQSIDLGYEDYAHYYFALFEKPVAATGEAMVALEGSVSATRENANGIGAVVLITAERGHSASVGFSLINHGVTPMDLVEVVDAGKTWIALHWRTDACVRLVSTDLRVVASDWTKAGLYGFRRTTATHTATQSAAVRPVAISGSRLTVGGAAGAAIAVGTATPAATMHLSDSVQQSVRLLLAGQEYYQSGNTSNSGVAFLLGANRPGNKQLWIGDSSDIGQGGTVVRTLVGSGNALIDAIATNGGARHLSIGNSAGVTLAPGGGHVGIGTASSLTAVATIGGAELLRVANHPTLRLTDFDLNSFVGASADRNGANYRMDLRPGEPAHQWWTRPAGAVLPNGLEYARMVITAEGRVGIGTSSPQHLLHVNGDASFAGTVTGGSIQAKYQDIAEWVPTTESMAAGTVVVVDASASNGVIASTEAYDTRVAGVVSPQPGLILGEAGDEKALIATMGRVRVLVDASSVPVRAGDLLVTSGRAGYAMKSEPVRLGEVVMHRPGTIIGKALESLQSGTGEIFVLLSMQ